MSRKQRLDPAVFDLPVERIRAGFFTDKYFVRTRDVLRSGTHRPSVLLQVFCRRTALLAGVDEAIAVLKLGSDDWQALRVRALADGDTIEPHETVMTIEGPFAAFANLETLYLGILSRRTRIATNTRKAVEAARPKDVLYFPARHDHWSVQAGDGYAAHLAGVAAVSTDAQAAWWGGLGVGTLPHAAIAVHGGDTVLAATRFAERLPQTVPLVVLVDFENDCAGTSLAVARALGERLYGVRLDTSGDLVDKSVVGNAGGFDPHGVNPQLVLNVRNALDEGGFESVRIVVSGGFDHEKIQRFERLNLPVDTYGVGSSLVLNDGSFDFTADVVLVDGKPAAKVGRQYRPNRRLQEVT